jgi:hypothetical protein
MPVKPKLNVFPCFFSSSKYEIDENSLVVCGTFTERIWGAVINKILLLYIILLSY